MCVCVNNTFQDTAHVNVQALFMLGPFCSVRFNRSIALVTSVDLFYILESVEPRFIYILLVIDVMVNLIGESY